MEGSEIIYIENDQIKAGIKIKGGEWCSLIDKSTAVEYIWQADPQYWGRSSCILFPTIGKLKAGSYTIDDQAYHLNQHGFLRNLPLEIIEQDGEALVLRKKSDPLTMKLYPFAHEVRMIYELDGPSLSITYEIYNNDERIMPFSIGAHPAFNVPVDSKGKRSHYQLKFNKPETLETMMLDDDGLIGSDTRTILKDSDTIDISEDLFDQDALILTGYESTDLSLIGPAGDAIWTFDFEGFPYLGIWSKNQASPFVCIEPWHGIADLATANGNLYDKKGIETLRPGERFACTHRVTLH